MGSSCALSFQFLILGYRCGLLKYPNTDANLSIPHFRILDIYIAPIHVEGFQFLILGYVKGVKIIYVPS